MDTSLDHRQQNQLISSWEMMYSKCFLIANYGLNKKININRNTLPATTKRQRTSHRTHTTKNHKFTLTLTPPSLQNETTNVVIDITVASS
jgi:hypothetical protein